MKIPSPMQQKREAIAPFILLLIIAPLLISMFYQFRHRYLYAACGILFGYVLQRHKLCFTAGLRDIFLLKSFTLTRAILLLLGLSTIAFALITEVSSKEFNMLVHPFGVNTLLGGLLFGIGMVVAGGCATGVLVRVGEGYQMQIFAFIGLLLGSLVGAYHYSLWVQENVKLVVNLQEYMGTLNALLVQMVIILALYFLCLYLEKGKRIFSLQQLKKQFSGNKAKNQYFKGAIYLSIINALFLYILLSPISITTGLTYFTGGIYEKLGGTVEGITFFDTGESLLLSPSIIFVFSIILGSFISSYTHREFRFRKVRSIKYIYMGMLGGFLMGYSARIAMGCNFGGFVNAVASMSLHGWVLGLSLLVGTFIGSKLLLKLIM